MLKNKVHGPSLERTPACGRGRVSLQLCERMGTAGKPLFTEELPMGSQLRAILLHWVFPKKASTKCKMLRCDRARRACSLASSEAERVEAPTPFIAAVTSLLVLGGDCRFTGRNESIRIVINL